LAQHAGLPREEVGFDVTHLAKRLLDLSRLSRKDGTSQAGR
jgi:hypothetical protein